MPTSLRFEFLGTKDADALSPSCVAYPDIYLSPAYGRTVEVLERCRWELARCTFDDGNVCCYVYLKRPIENSEYFDIVSPYGYAGPWGTDGVTEQHWCLFRNMFLAHAQKKGVVSEFVRFSPMLNSEQVLYRSACSANLHSWLHQETTVVHLQGSIGYPTGCSKRHRRKCKKAIAQGVECNLYEKGEVTDQIMNEFVALYHETMTRLDADHYYLFPHEYFRVLLSELADYIFICVVRLDARPIAAGLFLIFNDCVHYHLGASSDEGRACGGNDLMFKSVFEAVKQDGQAFVHLGGGMHKNDGLSSFKLSMSPHQFQWYLGKSVINETKYWELTKEHARLCEVEIETLQKLDYFPLYRTKKSKLESCKPSLPG